MNTDARFLLQALRSVWATVSASSSNPKPSLRAALDTKATAQFNLVSSGAIKSTSANGQRTEFNDSPGQPNPAEVLNAWVYLVEIFDRATAYLQQVSFEGASTYDMRWTGPPIAAPTDAQVEPQMEIFLRPVTGCSGNYMYLAK
jgi:hypothetical protein